MSREERTTSDARAAPTIPSTPRAFVLDGDIQEWRDHPPFVTLHKTTPDAREGLLWLGQAENGVVLAGQIFGDPPRWPPAPDMMARGDHIEVWLADPSGFEIVPLSWGNSRQWVGLTTEDDCSEVPDAARCKAWFRAHARAGQAVDRLFVRQWQLSPDHAVEAFADPAFQSLPAAAKRDLEPLRPSASPLAKFQGASTPDYAYTFEVLIPWEAFPPFHLLRLEDLRFRVEVVNPATEDHQSGPVSTTSPPRRYGEADRFSLMHLGQPRQYELTPCWIPVAQDDDGFFKPSQRLDIWEVLFETYHFACTHCRPTGQFFSVFVQPYYMRQLDETRFLCGPPARVLRRGQVYPSEFAIGPAFDVRQLPDGDLLIKQGPEEEERDSTGACGSCPYVFLAIYHLDGTTNALTRVFGEGRIQELGGDKIMRFEVSTDWMRIDVYVSQSEENEELTSYCFSPNPARYSNCTPPVAKSGTSTKRLDPGEEESR